ncbi:hypothetical protein [Spongiactinospora sp. TRM90649]|uniref:hypothetical protein n=1 Tax=Spongiactinospora sp. TRM90649 TaxID=3031114 RepID=UPI0023F97629|nr:hypothetical protein [Spongiactinospora sp. TRM90649]MDF5755965.1 hypothetical protein [Spongiactinospora sp. TRM90649]
MRTTAMAVICLSATLPLLAACSAGRSHRGPSGPLSAVQSPTRDPTNGPYMVGADPADDPCARVVSAIGFADSVLEPAGEERRQNFDAAVRGRLAYVEGVVREYGPRLPERARRFEVPLRDATDGLSPAATPREEQLRLLKQYRSAAQGVRRTCPKP